MAPAFRPLFRAELDIALEWAAAEGWNPGLADADAFWAADPEGFWGMEADGELIGSASIVSYSGKLGFVGLFIVRSEWRGQGLGTAFWNFFIARLRDRLQPGASASLDGVFAMQPYYAKSGFVFSHRNLRMEGLGQPNAIGGDFADLADLPFETICAYDEAHFGTARPEFLKRWISPADGRGLARCRHGEVTGIGVIRPCRRGYKIGPLFADDPGAAQALFRELSAHAAGQPIFLDIPENNPDAVALAARQGLRECFGCARMSMGGTPALPWDEIYGVTTFELG